MADDALCSVWIADLSAWSEGLPGLAELLDATERERAARFRFPEDRARYVIGRGLLRHGVRRYAPEFADEVKLSYSGLGRPLLPPGTGLDFSISHARDRVTIAFARTARVGIDVEFVQPETDLAPLVERIFSDEDRALFSNIPGEEERLRVFFRAWTRKEAYLKATGEGIATRLTDVTVSFDEASVTRVTDRLDPDAASCWRLHTLPLDPEYAGCLACDDPQRPVEIWAAEWKASSVALTPIVCGGVA